MTTIDTNFPNDRAKLKGGYAMIDMRGVLTNSADDQVIYDGGALHDELLAAVKSNKPIILCNMKMIEGSAKNPLSPIHVYALAIEDGRTVVIYSLSRTARPYLVHVDSDEEETITVIE